MIAILSAGNLATTQAVVTEPSRPPAFARPARTCTRRAPCSTSPRWSAISSCAKYDRATASTSNHGDPSASFPGRRRDRRRRRAPPPLEVYSAGNPVEASPRSCFLQIGETKYGKPILDRGLTFESSLEHAAKLALLSFDATMRSNLSVGLPIDLLRYEAGSLSADNLITLEERDAYWPALRDDYAATPAPRITHTQTNHTRPQETAMRPDLLRPSRRHRLRPLHRPAGALDAARLPRSARLASPGDLGGGGARPALPGRRARRGPAPPSDPAQLPVIGHVRWMAELIRPEIRQHPRSRRTKDVLAPFSRAQRSLVYQRAKGDPDNRPFGTQLDAYQRPATSSSAHLDDARRSAADPATFPHHQAER